MEKEVKEYVNAYWANEVEINALMNQFNTSLEVIADSPDRFDLIVVTTVGRLLEKKKELLLVLGKLQKAELKQAKIVDLAKYRTMSLY